MKTKKSKKTAKYNFLLTVKYVKDCDLNYTVIAPMYGTAIIYADGYGKKKQAVNSAIDQAISDLNAQRIK